MNNELPAPAGHIMPSDNLLAKAEARGRSQIRRAAKEWRDAIVNDLENNALWDTEEINNLIKLAPAALALELIPTQYNAEVTVAFTFTVEGLPLSKDVDNLTEDEVIEDIEEHFGDKIISIIEGTLDVLDNVTDVTIRDVEAVK